MFCYRRPFFSLKVCFLMFLCYHYYHCVILCVFSSVIRFVFLVCVTLAFFFLYACMEPVIGAMLCRLIPAPLANSVNKKIKNK